MNTVKNLFIVLIAAFMLFGVTSMQAKALKFVQITDCHVDLDGKDQRGRKISQSVNLLENTIEAVNKIDDAEFVVFSGDNIDVPEADSLVKFLKIVKKLNKPYYLVIGNHDVSKMSGMSKERYISIVNKHNKHQSADSGNFYFKPDKNIVVIVMDGAYPYIPSSRGFFSRESLEWLDETLTRFRKKKVIIAQHFPLAVPYEKRSHTIKNTADYERVLANHDNILAIISGHFHSSKVTKKDGIYHISTDALVESPHSFRVIEILRKKDETSGETVYDINTHSVDAEGNIIEDAEN